MAGMISSIEIKGAGWMFDEKIWITGVGAYRFAKDPDIFIWVEIEDEVCAWRI